MMQNKVKIFRTVSNFIYKLNRTNFHMSKEFLLPHAVSNQIEDISIKEETTTMIRIGTHHGTNNSSVEILRKFPNPTPDPPLSIEKEEECLPDNKKSENKERKKKEDLLKKYMPVDIDDEDIEENDEINIQLPPEDDEIPEQKRKGLYTSAGIKIFVPQKEMPPGTCKHRIDLLPPSEHDDTRIVTYH